MSAAEALVKVAATVLIAVTTMVSGVGEAHHSATRFDAGKPATLSGTVKTFRMSNPHCWIYLTVPAADGGTDEWELEGPPSNTLLRTGWTTNTLKPGMKVKILMSPSKDGTHVGAFSRLLEIDGKSTTVGTTSKYQ